ncbi:MULTISPECIES: FMN-binding protein [Ectothiorhodospira]|uniref:FMN-binding protein n=1 Tax=Ectothiorhodospira TaxID=1051 RepID=UPI0015A5F7EA|nr:FMN-binding protein [Ectothiorhodospira marina]MCG5517296.1 FMN-binding protein [Ectothiorhodospira sp. 9100]MCG5520187.1 FMN-binding protein [Ectothiorhodospira sp. 9905]
MRTSEVIPELYSPGEVVTENAEVDGFTSATIRSSKVISAIRDALNRGVYSY